ncbi:choice-of-anchor G family protein [Corynebacterium gallinarum]|uniref:Putative Ig domain-containing protein n=1 Tax=Corynebacterium gallinarum TaxID=2762214 RepID=A0A8I0LA74_9CORY|nr:choice-of-anchor G family protein [Corynebacterium gallinarum]MBD8029417.1 putative Ig domain-containing protein [Corynebacterium gallinarum]
MKIRTSALAISRSMRIGIAAITSTALVAGTLVAVPAHPLLPVTAVAQAQEAPFATAEGQVIDLSLFTDSVDPADREAFLTVLEAIRAEAQYPGNQSNDANVDLTLLEGIDVTISGVSIPLTDLLNIQGPAGVLGATASTPAGNQAYAAAGVLTDDGSIDLSATSGPGGVETVLDLSDILAPQLTDGIIDELSLRVGAVSASAERNGDQVTSEYALANADLVLDSPLVASVTDLLISEDSAAPGVGMQVDRLVTGLGGNTGLLNELLTDLEPVFALIRGASLGIVDINTPVVTLDSNIQETLDLLLAEPLISSSGAVTVNLATGEVTIDLEALGGTSAVDPNTDLLTEAAVAQISTELNAVLTDLVERVRTAVLNGLLETAVTVDISVETGLGALATEVAAINIDGTLNQILDGEDVANIRLIGLTLPGVNQTLQNLLGTVGDTLKGALNEAANGVIDTLLQDVLADVAAPLTGNLSTILRNREILSLTLNAQPNPLVASATNTNSARPNSSTGAITNPDEEFTVTGLHIRVLNGAVDLPLARATVDADAAWNTVGAPTVGPIADQTVTLGDAITPVTPVVTPANATVAVAGLPAGVSYNSTTRTITGTPTGAGTFNITVTATNDAGTARERFTVTVIDPNEEPGVIAPTIGNIDDQTGIVDQPITPIDVDVTPDTAEVTVVGLPDGLTYNEDTGEITGTPTEVGTSLVTVTAVNDGRTVTETFTITITERDGSGNGSSDNGSGNGSSNGSSDNDNGNGSGNGSSNGSSDNGNGNGNGDVDNGSSAFLQQCLNSPAAGLVGLLAALGAVSAIAGPALEPLLKSMGSAIEQQMRQLNAATSGAHQPAWVQTINRGLNDAANAVNHQMVSNALFATAALALVSSPLLCSTDGPGSSAGSSIGSS